MSSSISERRRAGAGAVLWRGLRLHGRLLRLILIVAVPLVIVIA